jgi:hypothetical protein
MTRSETPFRVEVESDVETFIIATDYALIRRELGSFTGKLPSGIYKFKFRRGTSIVEGLRELPANPPEAVVIKPPEGALELESPVPMAHSKYTETRQVEAARVTSRKKHVTHGQDGSSIYVFVRNAPGAPPRDVRAGLSLHALDESVVAGSTQFEAGADASCAALNVEVEPASYRLRMLGPDGPVEQIVVASPGWQTQVFLLHEPAESVPALATASVLMCRGGFNPDDEMLRLAESARIALTMQRGTMPRQLMSRLLNEKAENPMLGIYGAHAMVLSGGNDELLERVLQVLESLLPGHPDVTALRLGSASGVVIDTPPMLRTSWNAIVAANADGRLSLTPGSLASRIPATLDGGTPWLIWNVDALLDPAATTERNVEADLSALEALIAGSLDTEGDPAAPELSGPEEALYSYIRSRASAARYGREDEGAALESVAIQSIGLNDRRLARAFGTTVQQVQTTVSNLASKLKR